MATGDKDITGGTFSAMFAEAVHPAAVDHDSPVGVADVSWENCAWSVKTVKAKESTFGTRRVRLISGRNNPGYSMGIEEPLKDPQATGEAVISILNTRIGHALEDFDDLRLLVFVRDMDALRFCLFERRMDHLPADEFEWKVNRQKNLEGYDRNGTHRFTWQRHGSQLTVIHDVPESARVFSVRRPPALTKQELLDRIGFKEDWVVIDR